MESASNTALFPELTPANRTSYTDVMIDLELLGLEYGRPIIQIGLCFFDLEATDPSQTMGVVRLHANEQADNGTPCNATMNWWGYTNKPLLGALREQSIRSPALRNVLDQMASVVLDRAPQRVWADYPSFDIAHLQHAMQRLDRHRPWEHRQVHSSSTVKQMCLTLLGRVPWVEDHPGRCEHEAGSDAWQQALELCAWHAALRKAVAQGAAHAACP